MNKLTALYNMMKHMKDADTFKGTGTAEARMDDTLLGTLNSAFACAPGHCEKKMELRLGDEVLKIEHQGTEKLHGRFHGHHGHPHGCCGPKGKLGKAMFMLKVLDKTELQELEDGRKALTLTLNGEDLPQHLKAHLKDKCCGITEGERCCGHHEKIHGWMASCGCMDLDVDTLELSSVTVKIMLKADCSPAEMSAVVKAAAADKQGQTHSITINAACQHA